MPRPPQTFQQLVAFFLDFINYLIPFLLGLIFLYVIWKLIDAWVIHADDTKKQEEGKSYAIVGVIVFVLMLSTWGLVSLVREFIFGIY